MEIEKVLREDVLNGSGLKSDSSNICYCQLELYISPAPAADGFTQKCSEPNFLIIYVQLEGHISNFSPHLENGGGADLSLNP